MKTVTALAPAKINLTLDITGRRDDGYHLLSSVFQTIDLCDTVSVGRTAQGLRLSLSEPSLPTDERNTAYQAARRFLEATGLPGGADIAVCKRIPMQAGLAGGSADAAGVLVAMNALYGQPLDLNGLRQIGEQIGADVPFCLTGGTALVTGIGECIQPLPPLPEGVIVVAKPAVGVSTAEAYRLVDTKPLRRHPDTEAMCRALQAGNGSAVGGAIYNVFEEALALPQVAQLRRLMQTFHPLGCAMSGSGSAVFALFEDAAAAAACALMLQTTARQVSLCRPCAHGAYVI